MNKRRSKPLIPPLSGRWARAGLILLLSTTAVSLHAQTGEDELSGRGRGEASRPFFSIYAEGGLSWATDVWYQNLDAKRSYKQSPAVGGGIDFTIRPWVRVGAEYLWSRYRREQRLSQLDTKTMPIKAYGNYLMNFHNARLGAQFNFMELWPRRRAQWLNIWAGTGVGYTFARGNEYAILFSNTVTQDGKTTPLTPDASISNEGTAVVTGNVQTTNRHESFRKLYIPASLHIEADVSRRFTVGLKGEMDWLMNRKDIAPRNLIFALATVRYNFVASRAQLLTKHYEGELAALNDRVNTLQGEAAQARTLADREATARREAEQQRDDLRQRLDDCRQAKPVAAKESVSYIVLFDNDKHVFTGSEARKLRLFARNMRGRKLAVTAEASTPGTDAYNQRLSERRLKRVVSLLKAEGIAEDDILPQTAIGSQNGIADGWGRKVTIKSLP